MKTYFKLNNCKWHLIFSLTLMLLLILGGGELWAQEMKPPVPKESSSNLKMPKPVMAAEIKGQANLPESLRLGFAMDLSGMRIISF